MKQMKAILIGAGQRGLAYAESIHALPDQRIHIVAVADPIPERRAGIAEMFDLSENDCYCDWKDLLSKPKVADIAIIATMDDMHTEPALMAIEKGYNLLLEKPVAQTVEECIEIANAAERKGVKVLVCHVLRYSPFYKKVKELVMSGAVGDIMSIIQVEAVGNLHQSHSYVRGDWHREDETTPMLLAKCCHDLDIIQWLIDKSCKKVSSFGELSYFIPENAPEGAPKRCIDGTCPHNDTCPYNCKKVYLSPIWFRHAVTRGISKEFWPTDEEVELGLQQTNFGSCVYYANNNVVDHQVVNMEFEGGATAHLTMNAFNEGGRYIRIFGTKGELYANMSDEEITLFPFDTRERVEIPVQKTNQHIDGGHGGGDIGMINEMYDYFAGNYHGYSAADIRTSVQNHIIGFAAEKARHNDTVENVADFSRQYNFDYK